MLTGIQLNTLKDPQYLVAASDIYRYINSFLTDQEGVYYTSQDADLKPGEHSGEYFGLSDGKRKELGIPRIDNKSTFSSIFGWIFEDFFNIKGVVKRIG